MKNRYFLEIAFKGTAYHGWQKQPGHISVQQVCNEKISVMLGEEVNCVGCGRTDSGVHATHYFLHFDTGKELEGNFANKLNSFLPQDINVLNMFSMKKRIHARWDALKRTYEYMISFGKDPFRPDLVTITYENYGIDQMNKACSILKEYNNFECFSKTGNNHNHFLCEIFEASWQMKDGLLVFRISANRFLRSMVSLLVGTLLEVGKGKLKPEELNDIISSRDRSRTGKAVPACGLYLVDVVYPEGTLQKMEIVHRFSEISNPD